MLDFVLEVFYVCSINVVSKSTFTSAINERGCRVPALFGVTADDTGPVAMSCLVELIRESTFSMVIHLREICIHQKSM